MEYYLNLVRRLASQPANLRFRAKSLAIALFLEFFATKAIIQFFSKHYVSVYAVPSAANDLSAQVNEHFPPDLAEPLLGFAEASSDEENWIETHLPDGMLREEFKEFLQFGLMAIKAWQVRNLYERQTMNGAEVMSYMLARLVQACLLLSIVWTHSPVVIVGTIIAVMVSAVACLRGIAVT